jgi:hypothetical protein
MASSVSDCTFFSCTSALIEMASRCAHERGNAAMTDQERKIEAVEESLDATGIFLEELRQAIRKTRAEWDEQDISYRRDYAQKFYGVKQ